MPTAALVCRDRTTEYWSLRSVAHNLRDPLENYGIPPVPPPWARSVQYFGELEEKVQHKLLIVSEEQNSLLRPRFSSDSDADEARQHESIERKCGEIQRLIRELERLVTVTINPKQGSCSDEVHIANNARKILSSRLRFLVSMFKSNQESFAKRLEDRNRKRSQYQQVGSSESHQRLEREIKVSEFAEQGFSGSDIEGLLVEEHQNSTLNDEITGILESVKELHLIFEEINSNVIEQGSILDRVDHNLSRTEVQAERTHELLIKADEQQSSMCTIM